MERDQEREFGIESEREFEYNERLVVSRKRTKRIKETQQIILE